jgi:hypothetical protein
MFVPVGAEFEGEWVFERAEAQERPMNSQESYTKRIVAKDEFWKETYFLQMPTQITFHDGPYAQISHPSWSRPALAVINDGMLEFRIPQEDQVDSDHHLEISDVDSYETMMPVYSLTLDKNTMILQCEYFYANKQGKYIEGILRIHYKK